LETAKRSGEPGEIDRKVEEAMRQAKIEVHDEKGRWREATESDFIEVSDES
jgi:hypothetical protein